MLVVVIISILLKYTNTQSFYPTVKVMKFLMQALHVSIDQMVSDYFKVQLHVSFAVIIVFIQHIS